MKKRYYIVIAALLFGASVAKAQDHIKLDLQKTIQLANDSSLEAFRTQNMYLSGYWEYRTYKANRLPSLTLNMTPAEYNRDITKRYDSEKDLDVYRSQQSFYASGNLAIQQNFDLTGGTFYLNRNWDICVVLVGTRQRSLPVYLSGWDIHRAWSDIIRSSGRERLNP